MNATGHNPGHALTPRERGVGEGVVRPGHYPHHEHRLLGENDLHFGASMGGRNSDPDGEGAGKASGGESDVNLQVGLGAEKEEEDTLSRE